MDVGMDDGDGVFRSGQQYDVQHVLPVYVSFWRAAAW